MCFLLLYIILCSYFVSGLARETYSMYIYFFILLCLYFVYIDEYEYSCCLVCRGFYKPVLAQHDQCCIQYYNDIMCIFIVSVFKYMSWSKAK